MAFPNPSRATFTVVQHKEGWAVLHDGAYSDLSVARDEVMAAASRRARASNDKGQAAQVRIEGEPGFHLRRD